jgi:hypothetical protein
VENGDKSRAASIMAKFGKMKVDGRNDEDGIDG